MATYYVLPPRALLGARLALILQHVLPGMRWPSARWAELSTGLIDSALDAEAQYVVYREDLPDGADVVDALAAGFGAEPDDEIVEVRLEADPNG